MPSWFWKIPTENKEFNNWGLSIEYIAWWLILGSCVCIVRNQIQVHLSVYSTHLDTRAALQTAVWSSACTALCSHDAISKQSALCRNRRLGRGIAWEWAFTFPLLYNHSWRVSSNRLELELELELQPVNQLSPLNCDLCGNRGVLPFCFTAKSNRLLWFGEMWTPQLLLPSRQVCFTSLDASARAGKGGQTSPIILVMQKWFSQLANSVAMYGLKCGKICTLDLSFRWKSKTTANPNECLILVWWRSSPPNSPRSFTCRENAFVSYDLFTGTLSLGSHCTLFQRYLPQGVDEGFFLQRHWNAPWSLDQRYYLNNWCFLVVIKRGVSRC